MVDHNFRALHVYSFEEKESCSLVEKPETYSAEHSYLKVLEELSSIVEMPARSSPAVFGFRKRHLV